MEEEVELRLSLSQLPHRAGASTARPSCDGVESVLRASSSDTRCKGKSQSGERRILKQHLK